MIPELEKTEFPEGISETEVLSALHRIVASDAFGRAERPARFLRHLVNCALRGEHSLLKESVLGVDIFDRLPNWDPREVPIVRQEAARLRKRLAKYYENGGSADTVRIELPVGAYVPVFRRATPEAPIQAPEVQAVPVRPAKIPAAVLILAFSVLVGIGLVAWRVWHRGPDLSIAVLPFTSVSNDPADQYFVDSLTADVNDSLIRLKTVRVIARASTSLFKKQPRDLRDVARQLRVSHILEANVQRSGDDVTVVAWLVRTSNGARVWTNTYHRHASDVASVQTDLAEGVRTTLGVPAVQPHAKYVPTDEARRWYLKGIFDENKLTADANEEAQADYRKAIESDPNYSQAYEALGDTVWNRNIRAGESPVLEERKRAMELFRKSIELDPGRPSPHNALALYAMQYDWDWNRAERELQAALSPGPNAPAEIYYALLCLIRGRRAEAEQHQRQANDLDPISSSGISNNAIFLGLEGRFSEATDEFRKLVGRNTGIGPKINFYSGLARQGKTEEAEKGLLSLPQSNPTVRMSLAILKAQTGRREEALKIETPLEQNYLQNHLFMYGFASFYALLDDVANTLKWVAKTMDAREAGAMYFGLNSAFDKMRHRPAFRELTKRMDLDR